MNDVSLLWHTNVKFKLQDNGVRNIRGRIVSARPDLMDSTPLVNGKRFLIRVIAYLDGNANSVTRRHFWKKSLPFAGELERAEISDNVLELTGYPGAIMTVLAHNAIDSFHYVNSASVPSSVDTLDRRNVNADAPGDKSIKHKRALKYRRAGWNERQRIERTENMTYGERKKANEMLDAIGYGITADNHNDNLVESWKNSYLQQVDTCLIMG